MLAELSLGSDPRNPTHAGDLRSLLCARCGAVLPTKDPSEVMLSKLSQLSRFGLGADDRPLLSVQPKEDE